MQREIAVVPPHDVLRVEPLLLQHGSPSRQTREGGLPAQQAQAAGPAPDEPTVDWSDVVAGREDDVVTLEPIDAGYAGSRS
ncbi:hypothetical protein ACIRBY_16440 [Streptomyces sp. NPDC096136]|uniref:hypothetical protein n=1 Tax=Streptomyces sp. NPDC096136 TaxID=3366076 RepID=UPI0037F827A0